MSSYNRYTNLTTKGNLGFVAAGKDVVLTGPSRYDFEAGRPILYNPDTNKTIDAAGVATATKIALGVGHNPNGGFLATEIRHLGHIDLDLCRTNLTINVAKPNCAIPQIIDFEFGCTFTGRDYMLDIQIDDYIRRSYFKEGAYGSILVSSSSGLDTCTTCSDEENCDFVACDLVNKLNGVQYNQFPGMNQLGLNTIGNLYPIYAIKKYEQVITFKPTAVVVESDCDPVCAVQALVSFSATGISTVTFTNNRDPRDNTRTLVEQLPGIVAQINAALVGKGGAYLNQVNCCEYEIVVSTCLASPVLTGAAGAIASELENAFQDFTPEMYCTGCETPTPSQYACGIIIAVEPVPMPCYCDYPDGNPPQYYGRTVTINPIGDAWNHGSYRTFVRQEQVLPTGQGFFVQYNELYQSNGGQGFNYTYGADYDGGLFPRPAMGTALSKAIAADCEKLYCIWTVVSKTLVAGSYNSMPVYEQPDITYINVPYSDEVTVAAMQGVLSALNERGLCNVANIECIEA